MFVGWRFAQFGQLDEEITEIRPGLDLISLACGDEAHEHRGAEASFAAGDEEPILAPDRTRLHHSFRGVVVDGQVAILAVAS